MLLPLIGYIFSDRVDSLEDRQKTFFNSCAKNKIKDTDKEKEYDSIRKEYHKVLEICH